MNLNILYQNIGCYVEKQDCLFPVYLLYPKIPEYKLLQDEVYIKTLIKRHFFEVKSPEKGDLIFFYFVNGFHFGIYAGNNEFFHSCKKHGLRISRLSGYKKQLKGVYRWYHQ